MTTGIPSLCTVLDTGIFQGNNSALCQSTAQDWRQCYILLTAVLLPALGKGYWIPALTAHGVYYHWLYQWWHVFATLTSMTEPTYQKQLLIFENQELLQRAQWRCTVASKQQILVVAKIQTGSQGGRAPKGENSGLCYCKERADQNLKCLVFHQKAFFFFFIWSNSLNYIRPLCNSAAERAAIKRLSSGHGKRCLFLPSCNWHASVVIFCVIIISGLEQRQKQQLHVLYYKLFPTFSLEVFIPLKGITVLATSGKHPINTEGGTRHKTIAWVQNNPAVTCTGIFNC